MKHQRTLMVEDLLMAPWWVIPIVCILINIVIWFVIPAGLEAIRTGGITGGMLTGGYAGAQLLLAKMFNLAMALVFAFSLFYKFVLMR
jgi:hypothetical protein